MSCSSNLFKILILIISLYSVKCADCPKPALVEKFNLTQYMGDWYEIQSYPNENELDLTCVTAKYQIQVNETDNSTTVQVTNSGFNVSSNESYKRKGTAKQNPDSDKPGDFVVDFGQGTFQGIYQVLDTDYKHSLVYSCRKSGESITEYAWILSREKTLDANVTASLVKILKDAGSNTEQFKKIDQNKCSGAAQTTLTLSMPLVVLVYLLLTKITF